MARSRWADHGPVVPVRGGRRGVRAYVAGRALPPGSDYLRVFRFVGVTAFVGYTLALWQMAIWTAVRAHDVQGDRGRPDLCAPHRRDVRMAVAGS